jgi:hypothetical protein
MPKINQALRPLLVASALILVFSMGAGAALLWVEHQQKLHSSMPWDSARSIKASNLPIRARNHVSLGVRKDHERISYRLGQENTGIDLSSKINALHVISPSNGKVFSMTLDQDFDFQSALFVLSTVKRIYVFDGERETPVVCCPVGRALGTCVDAATA